MGMGFRFCLIDPHIANVPSLRIAAALPYPVEMATTGASWIQTPP